jgi:hypothetical protein
VGPKPVRPGGPALLLGAAAPAGIAWARRHPRASRALRGSACRRPVRARSIVTARRPHERGDIPLRGVAAGDELFGVGAEPGQVSR